MQKLKNNYKIPERKIQLKILLFIIFNQVFLYFDKHSFCDNTLYMNITIIKDFLVNIIQKKNQKKEKIAFKEIIKFCTNHIIKMKSIEIFLF